jgi:predicted metal-dependent hydrolase
VSGEIEFSQLFLVPPAQQAKRREVLRDWYIARAKEKILTRAEQHACELGVEFAAAKIVDNRYRWGSCTVNDNVSFNWRLIKTPMFVIETT